MTEVYEEVSGASRAAGSGAEDHISRGGETTRNVGKMLANLVF